MCCTSCPNSPHQVGPAGVNCPGEVRSAEGPDQPRRSGAERAATSTTNRDYTSSDHSILCLPPCDDDVMAM
eukprot:8553702-Pyramimonas_sp.AAC.1